MTANRNHIRVINAKGQVTIPAAIRKLLGLEANDRVIFRVVNNQIILEPVPMSLEQAFGSVTPLNRPEEFRRLRRHAQEERGWN